MSEICIWCIVHILCVSQPTSENRVNIKYIYLCCIIQTSNHCEGSSKKDTSKDTSKSHDKKVFLDL